MQATPDAPSVVSPYTAITKMASSHESQLSVDAVQPTPDLPSVVSPCSKIEVDNTKSTRLSFNPESEVFSDTVQATPDTPSVVSPCTTNSNLESQLSVDAMPSTPVPLSDDAGLKFGQYFSSKFELGYYDVLILYAEKDEAKARKYCESLNTIEFDNGEQVKAILYDDQAFANVAGTITGMIDIGVERCTFVFMFITTNFLTDVYSHMLEAATLVNSVNNPAKNWSVIPIWVESKEHIGKTCSIHLVLNALISLNLYKSSEDRHFHCVKMKVNTKLRERLEKEQDQRANRQKYLRSNSMSCQKQASAVQETTDINIETLTASKEGNVQVNLTEDTNLEQDRSGLQSHEFQDISCKTPTGKLPKERSDLTDKSDKYQKSQLLEKSQYDQEKSNTPKEEALDNCTGNDIKQNSTEPASKKKDDSTWLPLVSSVFVGILITWFLVNTNWLELGKYIHFLPKLMMKTLEIIFSVVVGAVATYILQRTFGNINNAN